MFRWRAFVVCRSKPGNWRSVSFAAVLALQFAAASAQDARAGTIVIHAERRADAIEVHASAQVKASVETAWRVLTAYERLPAFIPDLRTSRVIARRGNSVTVEQSGDARLWLLPFPIEVTFEILEFPPTGMQSRAVAGTFRSMESSYALMPGPSGMRIDYVGHIATGFGAFGAFELQAVKENISRQFQALADEIERQGTASRR